MKRIAFSLLGAVALHVIAEPAPTTFPAEAATLTQASLQEAIAGKTYTAKLVDGSAWKWRFTTNGNFYFESGRFFDTGTWNVKESALCSEGRKITASCNEIRQQGTDLFLKRDNGDIVKLTPQ